MVGKMLHRRRREEDSVRPDTPDRPVGMYQQVGERTDPAQPDYEDLDPTNDQPLIEQESPWRGYPHEAGAPAEVYVVGQEPSTRDFVGFSVGSITATNEPQEIGGMDRRRLRMRVRNNSEDAVRILVSATDLPVFGYCLPSGGDEEFLHNAKVCVASEPGTDPGALVTWFCEFEMVDKGD